MNKVIKITGLTLLIASFVLLLAFFATMGQGSGTLDSAAGEAMHVPLLTDPVLYWTYVLFAITIVLTVLFSLYKFAKNLASNPMSAIKTLIPLLVFAGIFVVTYILGSGERMSIIGYEGTQNEGVWAKISDMFIYTTGTMFVVILVAIAFSLVYRLAKK